MPPEYPALPLSRTAMDRLGERLARPGEATAEDLETLQSIVAVYDEILALTKPRVDAIVDDARRRLALDLTTPTGRIKTSSTIIEKLRREPSMGFKGMSDIAGIRIVGA